MTSHPECPSDVLGQRIKDVRKRRGWTAPQLAQRCSELGGAKITAQGMFNIENGRRQDGVRRRHITVDELITLALALEVAPVHLLVSLESEAEYPLTPHRSERSQRVRDWIRAEHPLSGMDPRTFQAETPRDEASSSGAVSRKQVAELVDLLNEGRRREAADLIQHRDHDPTQQESSDHGE